MLVATILILLNESLTPHRNVFFKANWKPCLERFQNLVNHSIKEDRLPSTPLKCSVLDLKELLVVSQLHKVIFCLHSGATHSQPHTLYQFHISSQPHFGVQLYQSVTCLSFLFCMPRNIRVLLGFFIFLVGPYTFQASLSVDSFFLKSIIIK